MKIQLFFLFLTLFLSINLWAQNPTWINERGSMNYSFSKYSMEGYNEQAYLWQDALLKGAVQTCTISEKITDAIMVADSKYATYYGKLSYNMEFIYNDKKQLEQLIVNDEDIKYKSPKTVKNIRKESLSWVLDQLHTRAYWSNGKCDYLVNYIYNDAGQIKKEHWGSISQVAPKVYIFPFEVLYDYKKEGGYTVTGTFKEDFDSKKGILKYILEFDEKGYLVKRTLYNKELKSRQENMPSKLETFVYIYNHKGYLTSMISKNGDNVPKVHCYKYIKEDQFGNWQIQQVYDDKKTLLFEMERILTYK